MNNRRERSLSSPHWNMLQMLEAAIRFEQYTPTNWWKVPLKINTIFLMESSYLYPTKSRVWFFKWHYCVHILYSYFCSTLFGKTITPTFYSFAKRARNTLLQFVMERYFWKFIFIAKSFRSFRCVSAWECEAIIIMVYMLVVCRVILLLIFLFRRIVQNNYILYNTILYNSKEYIIFIVLQYVSTVYESCSHSASQPPPSSSARPSNYHRIS